MTPKGKSGVGLLSAAELTQWCPCVADTVLGRYSACSMRTVCRTARRLQVGTSTSRAMVRTAVKVRFVSALWPESLSCWRFQFLGQIAYEMTLVKTALTWGTQKLSVALVTATLPDGWGLPRAPACAWWLPCDGHPGHHPALRSRAAPGHHECAPLLTVLCAHSEGHIHSEEKLPIHRKAKPFRI